jgi:prevent-host-death family protein
MPSQPYQNRGARSTKAVSAYEAKNGFSALLDMVERGESITITRHGRPVAKLVPYEEPVDRQRVAQAFAVFDEIAKGKKITKEEILALIREGRKG